MPTDTHTDAKGADAKHAAKTALLKRPQNEDEEAAQAPAVPVKQKTLPTGLSRAIVIAALIFSAAYGSVELLRDRYAIAPVPNSPNSFVYRIDRLTGALLFCGAQQCSVVHVRAAE